MCGIAGIYNRQGVYSKEQMASMVQSMCDKLVHRGPDDAGVWVSDDGQCALGHRRLSIIDLSTQAHQPYSKNLQYACKIRDHSLGRHCMFPCPTWLKFHIQSSTSPLYLSSPSNRLVKYYLSPYV